MEAIDQRLSRFLIGLRKIAKEARLALRSDIGDPPAKTRPNEFQPDGSAVAGSCKLEEDPGARSSAAPFDRDDPAVHSANVLAVAQGIAVEKADFAMSELFVLEDRSP